MILSAQPEKNLILSDSPPPTSPVPGAQRGSRKRIVSRRRQTDKPAEQTHRLPGSCSRSATGAQNPHVQQTPYARPSPDRERPFHCWPCPLSFEKMTTRPAE